MLAKNLPGSFRCVRAEFSSWSVGLGVIVGEEDGCGLSVGEGLIVGAKDQRSDDPRQMALLSLRSKHWHFGGVEE